MSRVKPLEWSELSDGWITHTPFGSYEVNGSVLRGRLGTCYDYFSSEHAKVAAQADYEQRILSTLKPEGEAISGEAKRRPLDDNTKAEITARQIWAYFNGGPDGAKWFDENKSLGGPSHIIALCKAAQTIEREDNSSEQISGAMVTAGAIAGNVPDEKAREIIQAALSLPVSNTGEWQPISTAPKDGSWVLLYWPTMPINLYPSVGFHHGDEYGWEMVADREYGEVIPTHWMPCPQSPLPVSNTDIDRTSEPKGHWEDGGKVWVEDHDCSLPENIREAREAGIRECIETVKETFSNESNPHAVLSALRALLKEGKAR